MNLKEALELCAILRDDGLTPHVVDSRPYKVQFLFKGYVLEITNYNNQQ